MANLHPDKLVGVARAISQRPRKPRASAEQVAVRAASKPKSLTPQKKKADSGLMEQLAFRLRDAHWNDHMDRLARGVDKAVAKSKSKGTQRPAGIKPIPMAPARGGRADIQPIPMAPAQEAPIIMLTIGANPPKRNG